ncbi:MAG: RNA polymerase sigma factor [Hyphobacterium sp.]|nr:MAG: RNA polymerase sigma factor [Hyphobacterium sp.]
MKQADAIRVFDELLLIQARTGDKRAAERLAIRWYPRLLRTARRILLDADLAEDAVQEAWASICSGWIGLQDTARFPAWAYAILSRKCTDCLRKRIRQRTEVDDSIPCSLPPESERRLALNQAFASLPNDQRIAATLYFGEGLALSEIALVTSAPVGTVKSRIFHARRYLKSALDRRNDHV